MYNDALLDELRQVERDVVEGERRLAEQESLVVSLKQQNGNPGKAQGGLFHWSLTESEGLYACLEPTFLIDSFELCRGPNRHGWRIVFDFSRGRRGTRHGKTLHKASQVP
jgi:hypothetical protein